MLLLLLLLQQQTCWRGLLQLGPMSLPLAADQQQLHLAAARTQLPASFAVAQGVGSQAG